MITSVSASTPKTTEELLNRLVILEKFIELKSNECAYYRSKVHLMQIHPLPTQTRSAAQAEPSPRRSISFDQSFSSGTQATQSNSIDERHRPPVAKPILKATKVSLPFDSKTSRFSSPVTRYRKEPKKRVQSRYAQNQNYFDEELAVRRPSANPQLLEQMLISYAAKHLPSVATQEKIVQCNEKDFQSIRSANTVLMIRLPRRFVKTLVEQQRKPILPKLKVQLSSELLHRLSQSIKGGQKQSSSEKFTIQSQFGSIIASFNRDETKERPEMRAVPTRMEVRSRLPPVRHLAKSKTELAERKKVSTKQRADRRKKRHIHRRRNSSLEDVASRDDLSTTGTQARETTFSNEDSSNPMSDVVQLRNEKQKNQRKNTSKE